MSQSQEALDRAVIEAAERLSTENENFVGMEALHALLAAVRARREAMRETKPSMLRRICSEMVVVKDAPWGALSEAAKDMWRERVFELLAAPDEPTEAK